MTKFRSLGLLLSVNFLLSQCPVAAQNSASTPSPVPDGVAQSSASNVKELVGSSYFRHLYAHTYWSLLTRLQSDGYLPESVTGAYPGMFTRTTGALISLFLETGRYEESERTLSLIFQVMTGNHQETVPHVLEKQDGKYVTDDEFQIDGQAHVLLAWARLALKRGPTPFEERTWEQVRLLMDRTCDQSRFQYGSWSVQPGLIRNADFEHSREERRWDAWDLLTQCFTGAALQDMTAVATRRGDLTAARAWQRKLDFLKQGVGMHLTAMRDGKRTYLEMRLPDGNGGLPYDGMGWVTLSPAAAQWEPLDHEVMVNTVRAMQQGMLRYTGGVAWMPTDGYPDGTVSNQIIGKGQGWEMDFSRIAGDYARIEQILKLIQKVNPPDKLYMEGAYLSAPGFGSSSHLTKEDVERLESASWQIKDGGNGEQTAWWCWAMARLREQEGLPPEPSRTD